MDILNMRWPVAVPLRAEDALNLYAVDGLCHNAEPGTYGHECGRPATWLGLQPTAAGWIGFCDACKAGGTEARQSIEWAPHPRLTAT